MKESKKSNYEIEALLDKAKNQVSTSPDEAMNQSQLALSLSQELGNRKLEAYSLLTMAFSYRVKSEVGSILDNSLKALEIFEELNDAYGKVKALNLAGISYFYTSMYEPAMRYFQSALELAQKNNDAFLKSSILNNIAEIYKETMSYDRAFENYHKALEVCNDHGFHINSAVIYGNIGEIHMKESRLNEALEHFYKGIKILEKESDPISLSEMEDRIGKVSQLMGNTLKAEQYYISALDRLQEINNKFYAINILINLGSLYAPDWDKSMYHYNQAIDTAMAIDANNKISQIYKEMAEYKATNGDYKEALDYYKLYSIYYDKQIAIERSNRLEIMNVELKYTKDFDQLLLLKNSYEEELKQQKLKLDIINKENLMLEKEASQDELTGVLNRRSIKKKFLEIVDIALIDKKPVALFMLDIDNFKKFNDYWGHLKGDSCLIDISKCIDEISRSRGEIFGRYGGEEFVYISRTESNIEAYELGEEIRKSVEELGFYYENNGIRLDTTISVGVCICSGENLKSIQSLYEEADRQLYRAKMLGRNRVCISEIKTLE